MANFIFKVENSGGMGDVLESAILIYSRSFFPRNYSGKVPLFLK